MVAIVEDWYLGSELNRIRLEVQQADVAVGEAWMDLITRIVIQCDGVTVDSDTEPSVFDWTAEKAASIVRLELGRSAAVAGDFDTTPNGYIPVTARIDFYHGSDNAVLSHTEKQGGLRFRIFA